MRYREAHLRSHRILVVEDFEPFRQLICSELKKRVEFQVTEASDGLAAIRKTEEQQPDLILLDIRLPHLDGLEVARRVQKLPNPPKILFLSQESSPDVVREGLSLGAFGYVHKLRARSDLLPAVDAVLEGKRFVSSTLKFSEGTDAHRHEVIFCSDNEVLLDAVASFIVNVLKAGDAAIVLVTRSHRDSLFQRLSTQDMDVAIAIQRGTLVLWDVRDALSTFMVNDWPDAVRLSTALEDLIKRGGKGPSGEQRRVVTCGECAPTLWADGKVEAAIHVEHLWNEVTRSYGVDTLCVYPSLAGSDDEPFKLLCAEHTAVHSR
jgi:DNA-binding response OmpR family regulator